MKKTKLLQSIEKSNNEKYYGFIIEFKDKKNPVYGDLAYISWDFSNEIEDELNEKEICLDANAGDYCKGKFKSLKEAKAAVKLWFEYGKEMGSGIEPEEYNVRYYELTSTMNKKEL